jgi:soluble epoxide hydrolase/lipid-phosphate phosphatase
MAHEWHCQIDHFSQLGYGIIAPDLLGYGGTSRPVNVEDYRLKAMAQDVIDILDHEGILKINGVGHDWGSYLLGRMAVHFPERLSKLAFLAVAYLPPGNIVDLDNINKRTEKKLGYPTFGYQKFFNESPDAIKLLDENVWPRFV